MTKIWVCAAVLVGLCSARGVSRADRVGGQKASAVLLLAESDGKVSTVNFGVSAVAGETERVVKTLIEKLGLSVLPVQGLTPMVGEPVPGLPLGDKAAANMAQQAGARFAVSVGVIGREEGPIRATQLVGHAVQLRVRMLDLVAGQAIFDKEIRVSGYGSDESLAEKLASSRALSKLMPQLTASFSSRFSTDTASAALLSIRIGGAQGWREVGAILSRLASTPGVDAVHVVEIGQNQVRLRVKSGASTASLVSSLRRARIPNGSLAVLANGGDITIELTMTSTSQPILNG